MKTLWMTWVVCAPLLIAGCGGSESASVIEEPIDKYIGTWSACTYTGSQYTKRTRTFTKTGPREAHQTIRTQDIFDNSSCTTQVGSGVSEVAYKVEIIKAATLLGLVGDEVALSQMETTSGQAPPQPAAATAASAPAGSVTTTVTTTTANGTTTTTTVTTPGYLAVVGSKLYIGALPLDEKGYPTQWSTPYTK